MGYSSPAPTRAPRLTFGATCHSTHIQGILCLKSTHSRGRFTPCYRRGLTLKRIRGEVLPIVREQQEVKEREFGDGPGTDWLRGRVEVMAKSLLELPHNRIAVLVSLDHLPFLEDALQEEAELIAPPEPQPTQAVRERSLLDFAFRGEVSEPGNLIAQLRELNSAEARFHEANLLLANGHTVEALDLLEATSHGDFSEPYYLPGYLLSRFGSTARFSRGT